MGQDVPFCALVPVLQKGTHWRRTCFVLFGDPTDEVSDTHKPRCARLSCIGVCWGGGGGAGHPQPSRSVPCTRATQGVVDRMGWTARTKRGGVGHLGLVHMEMRRGTWWTTGGQRCVGSKKPSNDTRNNQHNPRYTNDGAPRTRKRHQQEHRPQRPTERSDPTQHAKGRTGDRPGPRTETATRRNVTRGGLWPLMSIGRMCS